MKNFKDGTAIKIQRKIRQYIHRTLITTISLSALHKMHSRAFTHSQSSAFLHNNDENEEEEEIDPATFIKKNAKDILHIYT